jgi:hypothetical protein
MSSEGTLAQRSQVVAGVATRLFGSAVTPERVIGETLVRATQPEMAAANALFAAVDEGTDGRLPQNYAAFAAYPLAGWVETTFGLTTERESGALVRRPPTTVPEAAALLADQTGTDPTRCQLAMKNTLRAGSGVIDPVTKRPLFAFRLHQFLSKVDTVHVSGQRCAGGGIEGSIVHV